MPESGVNAHLTDVWGVQQIIATGNGWANIRSTVHCRTMKHVPSGDAPRTRKWPSKLLEDRTCTTVAPPAPTHSFQHDPDEIRRYKMFKNVGGVFGPNRHLPRGVGQKTVSFGGWNFGVLLWSCLWLCCLCAGVRMLWHRGPLTTATSSATRPWTLNTCRMTAFRLCASKQVAVWAASWLKKVTASVCGCCWLRFLTAELLPSKPGSCKAVSYHSRAFFALCEGALSKRSTRGAAVIPQRSMCSAGFGLRHQHVGHQWIRLV